MLYCFGCIAIQRTEASYANPRRGPMRAQVCPLSSLRMILCPTVPTMMVKSFMIPPLNHLNCLNGLNDLNYLDIHPMHILSPRTGCSSFGKNRIQPRQVSFCQFDLDRLEIFLEMAARLTARDGNNVIALRHEPGQRQLRRRCVFFFGQLFESRKEF